MYTTENYQNPWIGKSIQQWLDFFELPKGIEKTKEFGVTKFLEKTTEGSSIFPFTGAAPIVKDFNDRAYDLELLMDFEWPRWQKGGAILNTINTDFDALSIQTLLKPITVMLRADRFHDGSLVNCFKDDFVLAILRALQLKIIAFYKYHD